MNTWLVVWLSGLAGWMVGVVMGMAVPRDNYWPAFVFGGLFTGFCVLMGQR